MHEPLWDGKRKKNRCNTWNLHGKKINIFLPSLRSLTNMIMWVTSSLYLCYYKIEKYCLALKKNLSGKFVINVGYPCSILELHSCFFLFSRLPLKLVKLHIYESSAISLKYANSHENMHLVEFSTLMHPPALLISSE